MPTPLSRGSSAATSHITRTLRVLLVPVMAISFAAAHDARAQPHAGSVLPGSPDADSLRKAQQSKPITLEFRNTPLRDAIQQIADAAGLQIVFGDDVIPADRRVTARLNKVSAEQALKTILSGTGLVIVPSATGRSILLRRPTNTEGTDTTRVYLRLRSSSATLQEVKVERKARERETFDKTPNVGVITMTGRALNAAPAMMEADVLRSVQLLPGVAPTNDFSAGYTVEGGMPAENLVLLDGIPIYSPFHLGGLFSTFIDGAAGRVNLSEGGFGAQYGGRMSSVLDVTSARPVDNGAHGNVNVSFLASSMAMGGLFDNARGEWNIAARRTYADKIASIVKRSLPYHFSDAQAHVAYELPTGTHLSLTGYSGSDVLKGDIATLQDTTTPGTGTVDLHWGNQLVGGTISHPIVANPTLFGDSTVVAQQVASTRYFRQNNFGSGSLEFRSSIRDFRLASSIARYSSQHVFRLGYERDQYHINYQLGSPSLGAYELYARQQTSSSAVYVSDEWHPSSRLILQAGLRYERVPAANWSRLSPRISLKYFLDENTAITAAYGHYAQWLQLSIDESSPLQMFDYWVSADKSLPVASVQHYVLGMERWLSHNRFMKIEGYYKPYAGLFEANQAADPINPSSMFLRETGRSYGATLLIRQLEVGNVGGWLSYSYGVSMRKHGDTVLTPLQDRRHTLNFVATWKRGKYQYGTRIGFMSGQPYTAIVGDMVDRVYDPVTGHWIISELRPIRGPRNGARLPAYQRVDLSVSRTYLWRNLKITPTFSLINALNSENPFQYSTKYDTDPPKQRTVRQFPFFPSLGAKVEF